MITRDKTSSDNLVSLNDQITELDRDISGVQEQIKLLHNKLAPLLEQRDALNEALGELMTVDWHTVLDPDARGGMTVYNKSQAMIEGLGLWCAGYWSDTNQRIVKLMMTYGDPASLVQTKKGLETIAPYITPQTDGMIWFGIFDRRLNIDGSYTLHVAPDLTKAVIKHGYGIDRASIIFEGPLDGALTYVQENLWYKGGPSDDDWR